MAFRSFGRLVLAAIFVAVAAIAPALVSAAQVDSQSPVKDAWVNSLKPTKNYGPKPKLHAQAGTRETFIRFRVDQWLGQSAAGMQVRLYDVEGDATALVASEVAGWKEARLTWTKRPELISDITTAGKVDAEGAYIPVAAFFPDGVIDRNVLSLRLTSTSTDRVTFSSREGSHAPQLLHPSAPHAQAGNLTSVADAYTSPLDPGINFGSVKWLPVDGGPVAEAYLAFDVSQWTGQNVSNVTLKLYFKDAAGKGFSVYRLPGAFDESGVTWETRPPEGTFVAKTTKKLKKGARQIDISAAYPDGRVQGSMLYLRLASTSSNGVKVSAREGKSPAQLSLTAASAAVPSTTPSPSPTATATPSPTATATPTPTPTDTPDPTPTPDLLYFSGFGSEHGVGMSQYGARGRADAGQTYDQILAAYYTGTHIGHIPTNTIVRVRLAKSYVPTSSLPARITARGGGWKSTAFLDGNGNPQVFPADSYVQMVSQGGWHADVRDSAGNLLASVVTTDLMIEPADDSTLLEMKWRDKTRKNKTYRGSMRLRINGNGVQCINHVTMNDYLRGVVPSEMPPLWNMEAVKTQAVAARSYAYVRLAPDSQYFDVVPTSDNQVYAGTRIEHKRTDKAVAQTAGEVVMTDTGEVANAFFFTIAGGATENNENVWVSSKGKVTAAPISYLRGIQDVDENGVPYDKKYAGYAWSSGTFTWQQLQKVLNRDSRTEVGTLLDVQFTRGVSGRVIQATITGTLRTAKVSGAIFKSVYNKHRIEGPKLKSTLFYLKPAG